MDVKASARAKHAFSQRGRARHSTRKKQIQPHGKQQQEIGDSQQHDSKKDIKLPSNWSRYEGEPKEDEGGAAETNRVDVPSVKSKGANYRDLLAEKSMLQGSDLANGRKHLMLTHGQDLWSQFTDMDNMWNINEDSGEENFFTLDVNFICEELAKLDIAERLLLDAEFACAELSDGIHKVPEAETDDELSGRLSCLECSSSKSPLDIDKDYESTSAGNSKALDDHFVDVTLIGKDMAASEWTENHAGTFLNMQLERLDGDFHMKAGDVHVEDTERVGKVSRASEWADHYSSGFSNAQPEIPHRDRCSLLKASLVPLPNIQPAISDRDVHLNAGKDYLVDTKRFEKGGASEWTENCPDRFFNAQPDCDTCSLSKDPLVPLPRATSLFDAKSAEAELDALLDMLDNKVSGQASSVMPMDSLGLRNGPPSLVSEGPDPEILQPSNAQAFNIADEIPFTPIVRASNESPFQKRHFTNLNLSSATPDVDTSKSVFNLEGDFDEWLDSLEK